MNGQQTSFTISVRWAGHVARMGGSEMNAGLGWENLKERDNLGRLGVDGG